jgi:hypothetical protein
MGGERAQQIRQAAEDATTAAVNESHGKWLIG